MEKIFFSEKNVNNVCTLLIKQLNVKDNPDTKKQCQKLLIGQMEEIFDKYGSKKPSSMSATNFLDAMNKKSIKQSVIICEENRKKKGGISTSQSKSKYKPKINKMDKFQRKRDEEINGERDIQIDERSKPYLKNTKNKDVMFSDIGMVNHFAPIDNRDGGYITATGEMGERMIIKNQHDQGDDYVREDKEKDLENILRERQNGYVTKNGGGDGGGNRSPSSYGPMPGVGGSMDINAYRMSSEIMD